MLRWQYSKQYIRQEVADNHLVVISVEVRNDCDHTLMQELTGLTDDKHVTNISSESEINEFIYVSQCLFCAQPWKNQMTLNELDIRGIIR